MSHTRVAAFRPKLARSAADTGPDPLMDTDMDDEMDATSRTRDVTAADSEPDDSSGRSPDDSVTTMNSTCSPSGRRGTPRSLADPLLFALLVSTGVLPLRLRFRRIVGDEPG